MSTPSDAPVRVAVRLWIRRVSVLCLPLYLLMAASAIIFVVLGIGLVNGNSFGTLTPTPELDTWPDILIPVLCMIVPGAGFALLILYASAVFTGAVIFSDVIVRPDGIEVCQWPHYHVHCDWADLQKETGIMYLGMDTLQLAGARTLPDEHSARWFRLLAIRQRTQRLSLWFFEGYPDGPLGDALRQNAPHLFP